MRTIWGLSKYWGGGLKSTFKVFKKYSFGKLILKEKDFINQEIGNETILNFMKNFTNKNNSKFLKKTKQFILLQLLAVKQFKKKFKLLIITMSI